jgi:hypothetical protein
LVLLLGAVFNLEYIHFFPAIAQVIMFNEPIILFLVLVNLPFSLEDIGKFKKVLVFLIGLELFIGIMQLPTYLSTGDSESFMGTFQHNAEQYSAFLLLSMFYLIGVIKNGHNSRILFLIIILCMFSMILAIDNKASWIGVGVSIFYLLFTIGRLNEKRVIPIKNIIFFIFLTLIGLAVITKASGTLKKFDRVSEALTSGNLYNIGKIKAYRDVLSAYYEEPQMFFFGSGPGTFYSRSAYQFYNISEDIYQRGDLLFEKKRPERYRTSDSMGGVIKERISNPFYQKFYKSEKIFRLGSGTTDLPFSSIAGLMGESGIIGTVIYIGFYIMILKKLHQFMVIYQKDRNIFPIINACIGSIIYTMVLATYREWFEVGRMTTILWSLIAMVFIYSNLCKKVKSNKFRRKKIGHILYE